MADCDHIFVGGGCLKPNPKVCCEKCVFGRGEHAEWCAHSKTKRDRDKRTRQMAAFAGTAFGTKRK